MANELTMRMNGMIVVYNGDEEVGSDYLDKNATRESFKRTIKNLSIVLHTKNINYHYYN